MTTAMAGADLSKGSALLFSPRLGSCARTIVCYNSPMPQLIIGRNPLLEALKAGRPLEKVLVEEGARGNNKVAEIVGLAEDRGIDVEYVSRQALERHAHAQVHQGVLAFAVTLREFSLQDVEELPREKNEPAFYVVLDGIEDPHNLGAILRTAEATGVHAVITRSRRAVGLTAATVKAAAGAAEYVPLVTVVNIAQVLEVLKKKGAWIVGIDMAGAEPYTEIDYTLPTAIVIGAEGTGISPLVKRKCDFLASIPMRGKITSLNASVAAGVVLYEVVKQRMRHEE